MLTRRALLAGLGATVAGCRSRASAVTDGPSAAPAAPPAESTEPPARPASTTVTREAPAAASPAPLTPPAPARVEVHTLRFGARDGGPEEAVVLRPSWATDGARLPLLVALGGLGETRRGMSAGAWAWVKDYWLDRAMKRLASPPLTSADFQRLVEPARLAAINASLAARPFRGLLVACPFTPDLITPKSLTNAGPFARFVVHHLVPRVAAEAGVEVARSRTGIDGVSLGGRLSLLVALEQRDAFGAVGVMQGAFDVGEVAEVAERTASWMRAGGTRLRLITSERDFYKDAIEALHHALADAGVAHDHLALPGPHDYPFNRGPGAIEMLLWHDRVLRGEAPDP